MLRTEHTSTAVRRAAAGAGIVMAPARTVRGAVGEDRAPLSPPPRGTGARRSSPGSRRPARRRPSRNS
ncbi:hypothetical protein [Streptomyces sp. NPDC090021]|uniref:hypothetical protein n=1 Tax=Streptomyces sp. NPDC090021 TaxID=3365919 RepID=UPI003824BCBC